MSLVLGKVSRKVVLRIFKQCWDDKCCRFCSRIFAKDEL